MGSDRGNTERGETLHGNAERGGQLYESRCGGCHSVDAHRIGPMHRGVFGRRAGSAARFDYSPALKASRIVWNEATLDRWLADPERLIAGQAMGYRVDEPRDRADPIAHLRQLQPFSARPRIRRWPACVLTGRRGDGQRRGVYVLSGGAPAGA